MTFQKPSSGSSSTYTKHRSIVVNGFCEKSMYDKLPSGLFLNHHLLLFLKPSYNFQKYYTLLLPPLPFLLQPPCVLKKCVQKNIGVCVRMQQSSCCCCCCYSRISNFRKRREKRGGKIGGEGSGSFLQLVLKCQQYRQPPRT